MHLRKSTDDGGTSYCGLRGKRWVTLTDESKPPPPPPTCKTCHKLAGKAIGRYDLVFEKGEWRYKPKPWLLMSTGIIKSEYFLAGVGPCFQYTTGMEWRQAS